MVVGALAQKELQARIEVALTGIAKPGPAAWTNRTREDRQNICIVTIALQQVVDEFKSRTDFFIMHAAGPVDESMRNEKVNSVD